VNALTLGQERTADQCSTDSLAYGGRPGADGKAGHSGCDQAEKGRRNKTSCDYLRVGLRLIPLRLAKAFITSTVALEKFSAADIEA